MNNQNNDSVQNDVSFATLVSELDLFDKWFESVLSDASDSVPRGGTSWVFGGGARKAAWHGWAAARGIEE